MRYPAILFILFLSLSSALLQAESATFENMDSENPALFSEEDIKGSGGGLVLNYGHNFKNSAGHFNWGGRFYFNLKDFLRLGIYGNLIKSLDGKAPSGYLIAGMVEPLVRFDPFILGFPILIGLFNYDERSYFSLYPQVESELRITPDFSLSLLVGYMMMIDGKVFTGERMFWDNGQLTVGLALSFG